VSLVEGVSTPPKEEDMLYPIWIQECHLILRWLLQNVRVDTVTAVMAVVIVVWVQAVHRIREKKTQ
jgi:hypothetical protein